MYYGIKLLAWLCCGISPLVRFAACRNDVLKWICLCVRVLCTAYDYDKQLWFSNNFIFIGQKLEKYVCARECLEWAPKVHHIYIDAANGSVQTCTLHIIHCTSVHIVIIPFTQILKCSISITSYAKRQNFLVILCGMVKFVICVRDANAQNIVCVCVCWNNLRSTLWITTWIVAHWCVQVRTESDFLFIASVLVHTQNLNGNSFWPIENTYIYIFISLWKFDVTHFMRHTYFSRTINSRVGSIGKSLLDRKTKFYHITKNWINKMKHQLLFSTNFNLKD